MFSYWLITCTRQIWLSDNILMKYAVIMYRNITSQIANMRNIFDKPFQHCIANFSAKIAVKLHFLWTLQKPFNFYFGQTVRRRPYSTRRKRWNLRQFSASWNREFPECVSWLVCVILVACGQIVIHPVTNCDLLLNVFVSLLCGQVFCCQGWLWSLIVLLPVQLFPFSFWNVAGKCHLFFFRCISGVFLSSSLHLCVLHSNFLLRVIVLLIN